LVDLGFDFSKFERFPILEEMKSYLARKVLCVPIEFGLRVNFSHNLVFVPPTRERKSDRSRLLILKRVKMDQLTGGDELVRVPAVTDRPI
jgi:hypothetical protein